MYVRSIDVLEQELKDFLSNPHSSKTLAKAVNKAKLRSFELSKIFKISSFLRFKISLPITMKNNDMDFYQWSSTDILILNKFGIPEPQKKSKVIPDILLIPLVSFDKNLFRIGYGGGFYDRYIEKVSKLKKTLNIGIAHSCQKVSKVPLNKYDKKLDIVITEKYILS